LTYIPDSIALLTNLEVLELGSNALNTLPDSIAQLVNLRRLDLSNNSMQVLPEVITDLRNVQILDLSFNEFSDLPNSIARLTQLRMLDISFNSISLFPAIITQLKNLRSLDVRGNQLSTIPETIGQLIHLNELELSANQIYHLPVVISQLSNLQKLVINGNPLQDPPLEIATQGIPAIRTYFAERTANPDDIGLYESKLLLVGEGRVGKTSLSKSLRIPNYELEDEQSTEGIDIQTWTIPKAETGLDEDFQLNVWDFGGQEIYHATHQFFLTRRSLYLLVTESRREDKHEDFYYWFNIIRLLGDNAPVVVVLNKSDQPTKELPIEEYRKTFGNIVHYEKVSCAQGWSETIANLKANIRRILTDKVLMPHVGDRLPGVWVRIRRDLAALREQGLDYIPYQQFLNLCAQHNMVEPERINLVGGYFHDLGIFLHFRDDWDLRDTVFLNHEWVTDGVYNVLDSAKVKAQQGRFTDDDLMAIWSDERYRDKRRELLALMKNTKFELCYELPPVNGQRQGYLAPQLLPVDEIAYPWRTHDNNLRFEYRYDFMPKGILSRFIVKRHQDIVQATDDGGNPQQVHWRYGVLLEWEGTRALVRERYFEKKITITVEGTNKIGFLAIIRRSIQEIHNDFHNLQVHEMVPCNCAECRDAHRPHFFRHEILERYLRRGRYQITCEISVEDVDVRTLLRETFLPEPDREEGDRYYISGDLIRGDKIGADKIGGHKAGGDLIDVGDIHDANGVAIGKDIDRRD
jgi:GTPase SAR1 family protein